MLHEREVYDPILPLRHITLGHHCFSFLGLTANLNYNSKTQDYSKNNHYKSKESLFVIWYRWDMEQ